MGRALKREPNSGNGKAGSQIEITDGQVEATGGNGVAGIDGGYSGTEANNNTFSGDAVVYASSGGGSGGRGGKHSGGSSKTGDPFAGGVALALLGAAACAGIAFKKRK